MQSIESEAKIAQEYLARIAKDAEAKFDEHLPPVKDRPCRLHEAMRYSMFAGGKRLRPGLAKATFDMFGGKGEKIWLATSALEMLHTFSLIHDDLPCVDNDDYRRGKLTSHKKFGEATAVMAGDALCIHAFEMMGKTGNAKAIELLAHLLGTYGMIGGEMTDIECEGKTVDLEIVDYIHYHKTAALIEASLLVGAMLAKASEKDMEIIRNYGRSIGLAFQIVDDILDIVSTTEELGKDAGSDIEKGKATYPSIVGLEKSRERARELYEESIKALDGLTCDTSILRSIAAYIITRVK
ncbi:geranylgeranyl diphosphate synthase [Fibrobacter succinogenes subsp. succinogenes S85]|jgi:geranylgeranyl diphosphate synthase type II|uniref:Geranylgeranyl diphosphate synthase n=2 Tax=Fibrobacter succinogenes TaxID=833 RepID=C9RRQ5_FIBSS|nr:MULTISPECIES: farnesyl diphosphate synthase [Fibrobacter]ACX75241.1 Polyprenyl synthetase [Fibrobacter succinogenes subsp. succinogenes S85]ADL25454.1 geranylgeranyl diphosphate synthase [Fibrobacter succinogenes subsp. succinogenes S85]PWJ34650.1 geranylgeranyl diphosphate synthase type II [Fibrobacter succinogenes subsp. elongatus]SUQ24773.1 geranylgeranyl diphosphate synthase, type II [Fibrobacter succinogenes]